MSKTVQNTCIHEKVGILYFHRSLKDEFEQKSQLTSQNWSHFRDLFQTLHKKLHHTLNQVNLPVFEITSYQQQGTTFGERLSHAVSSVFEQGVDHVIIVGNDCPQLHPKALEKAKNELTSGRPVIGPDHHGGAYLIGLSRNQFEEVNFASLPWQKPELLDSLKVSFENATFLERFQDLNTRKDLLVFTPKAFGFLKTLLLTIFWSFKAWVFLLFDNYSSEDLCFHLRPPPEIRH